METHNSSLPPDLGKLPDVRLPSWVEGPTNLESTEVTAMMTEIANLKGSGLTAQVVVIDFVYHNIQPLKYWVFPTFLYTRIKDPTSITDEEITQEDVLSRVDMMLKVNISNEVALCPIMYGILPRPMFMLIVLFYWFRVTFPSSCPTPSTCRELSLQEKCTTHR